MAPPAPDAVTQQREERRTDGEGQALVVGKDGQRQRHHHVDGPAVDAPVQIGAGQPHGGGVGDGLSVQFPVDAEGRGRAQRRGDVGVIDRFQHAEEQQADANAGREQHREPGQVAILRRGVWAAQADLAVGQHDQCQTEQDEAVHHDHEVAVEGAGGEADNGLKEITGSLGEQQRQHDEDNRGQRRDGEDPVMYIEADGPQAAFEVVLPDGIVRLHIVRNRGWSLLALSAHECCSCGWKHTGRVGLSHVSCCV